MKISLYVAAFCLGLVTISCSKESEENSNPEENCVTDNLSFENDVLVIFDANCNGCHGSGSSLGGITLDEYDQVKTVVDGNRLLGAIRHESGFSSMPKNASKLSDCNIDIITAWIAVGAPNN